MIIRLLLLFIMLIPLSGFALEQGDKPKVLATIKPLALIVEELAGDLVDVDTLIDGASSPHHFSLRPSDLSSLRGAHLLVRVGSNFESFLKPDFVSKLGSLDVSMTETVAEKHSHSHNHDHHEDTHEDDLHLWLSLHEVEELSLGIVEALKLLIPKSVVELDNRLQNFNAQLLKLDESSRADFAGLKKVGFAVYHHGYGHFNEQFALNQLAYVTLLPDESLSAKKLFELKQSVSGANCLIVEENEFAAAEKISQKLNLRTVKVDLLATSHSIKNYSDYFISLVGQFEKCLSKKNAP